MSLKNQVTPPRIDPWTVRLVAQRLNHYATPGPWPKHVGAVNNKSCAKKLEVRFCVGWTAGWEMNNVTFLGAFTKFLRYVCPSFRMEQLGFHSTDFHEIWYLNIFRKSVEKIQVSLKSDKNNGYCT
jgi:hypothetical protein